MNYDRLRHTARSGEAVGCIGTDDPALAEEANHTSPEDAKRALADRGAMDRGTEDGTRPASRFATSNVVYVLETGTHVKIGLTKNIGQRLSAHRASVSKTYGQFRFVGWVPGSLEIESRLQLPIWASRAAGPCGTPARDWFVRSDQVDSHIASIRLRHPEELGLSSDAAAYVQINNPRLLPHDTKCFRCGSTWCRRKEIPKQCPQCKATGWQYAAGSRQDLKQVGSGSSQRGDVDPDFNFGA